MTIPPILPQILPYRPLCISKLTGFDKIIKYIKKLLKQKKTGEPLKK